MALDTRQAPVVLTLQERTTGKAVDLQGHDVVALHQIVGDIELSRHIGVFAITHTLTIDPKVETVAYAVEAHIDIVPRETVGGNVEVTPVGANGIGHRAVVGEPTWTLSHDAVSLLVEREGIGHVTIQRLVPRFVVVQAPYLPTRRHVDIGPRCIVVVLGAHRCRCLRWCVHPLELPHAVQRLIERRQRQVVLHNVGLALHRQCSSVSGFSVHT